MSAKAYHTLSDLVRRTRPDRDQVQWILGQTNMQYAILHTLSDLVRAPENNTQTQYVKSWSLNESLVNFDPYTIKPVSHQPC